MIAYVDKKVSKGFEWKETETTAPKFNGEFQNCVLY